MNNELSQRKRTVITIFMLVVLGAMIGWIYEMLFYRIDMGHFIRRGQGGPWLPIYGFGALGLTLVTYKRRVNPLIVFIITMIGAGIIEFVTGWTLYNFFNGMRLWDYNTEIWNWGNIDGYVCTRSVLLFGVFGALFGALIIPKFMGFVKKAKSRPLAIFSLILAIVVGADVLYGYVIKSVINGGL